MSRAIFVSDIHITSPDDPKYALFLRLLDTCLKREVEHVFLVGDIFDFWIADRKFLIKTYSAAAEKLRQLANAGCKVHYFEGNHDLDLRPYWQHKLGLDVHSSAAFFELDGVKFRVEHGDQMDPEDRGYLFLRWLLRTPLVVFLGRFAPQAFVRWVGRRASGASRDYTSQVKVASDGQVRDKIKLHALKVHGEHPFDILVSGHVHVADDAVAQLPAGAKFRSVNLGTWLKQPVLFTVQGGLAKLVGVEEWLDSK